MYKSLKNMDLRQKIKLSRDVMVISGIFCAFVAILLLLNMMQISRNDPLESDALESLVERLASDPNNEELKQDIRNLDLLARKAHFTSEWQVRTGALLLFAAALVFALALWYYRKLQSVIEEPALTGREQLPARLKTQRWLLTGGALFLLAALVASFFTTDHLALYQPEGSRPPGASGAPGEAVERLTITRSESGREAEEAGREARREIGGEALREEYSAGRVDDISAAPSEEVTGKAAHAALTTDEIVKQHNSFRGPSGLGISSWSSIPVDWDGRSGRNLLWKTAIPKPGYNSPVIWADRIFLSGADAATRTVYCVDRNSGKILWEQHVTGVPGSPATMPDVTDDTGLAASSLAVDGRGVYAIFATGDLIAFDMDGRRLWARNLGVPDNHYGHSSSLLTLNSMLFVQYDTHKGGRLLGVNCSNGNTMWDIRRENNISWASPILISVDGKHQLVTSSDPAVAAHDPATGNLLWSVECMMGEVGPSPAFSDGVVFAANEYARLVAIEVSAEPSILWTDDEYLPEASSPAASRDLLFVATSYGVIACYDTKTGKKQWEHDASRGFYSSPVIADGKVYLIDLGGTMYIFRAAREKTLLGQPQLGEDAFATPAFSEGRIYLRGEKNLYCFGVE